MKPSSLALCLALLLAAPAGAVADDLCGSLTEVAKLVPNGLDSIEGEPLGPDSHYRRSKIQFSAEDQCAIEAHRSLSCAWEPSTEGDLVRMTRSVAACFPSAQQTVSPTGDDIDTVFKLEGASIHLSLTADVLSLDIGP